MFPTAAKVDELQRSVFESLYLFLPELVVCAGIILLLLTRLLRVFDRAHLGGIAVVTLVLALAVAGFQVYEANWAGSYFSGMLASDAFAGLVRCLVLVAALVTVVLTQLTGIPDRDDSEDSRYWGFIDDAAIKGKPLFIYYSFDPNVLSPFPWITEIRWDRIGGAIR